MKFCTECGAALDENTRFCIQCGARLAEEPAAPEEAAVVFPVPEAPEATPEPEPAYIPDPEPQPAYIPDPEPQPAYIPDPEPQPAYTPDPEPQPAYTPPRQNDSAPGGAPPAPPPTAPVYNYQPPNTGAPVYQNPDAKPGRESRYAPITAWGYLGILLLLCIPVVNLILVIVWACGGCRKVNKRSLARGILLFAALALLVSIGLGLAFRSAFRAFEQDFREWYREEYSQQLPDFQSDQFSGSMIDGFFQQAQDSIRAE